MSHSHAPANFNRAFALGIALNLGFVIIEGGFGFWADSLALLADAGHNLGDVLGLLLAWGGSYLAGRSRTPRRTYGLRRASVLAALLNAILLLVAVGGIAWEAVWRFGSPKPVAGLTVIGVAAVGVVINTLTALLFMSGRHHDLNVRGAYLHMAADAGVSVAVVIAGILIRLTGEAWIDSAASLLVAAVIVVSTWGLLRESLNLSLDAVPAGIDAESVGAYFRELPGISVVRDLHIWGLSTTEAALTVRLVKPDGRLDDELLARVRHELHERFGIEHVTVQFEQNDVGECGLGGAHD